MRWPIRLSVAGISVALAVGIATPLAGAETFFLKVAKHRSGPYSESINLNIGPDEKKDFFLRARNTVEEEPVVGTLKQLGDPDYRVRYFKGDKNVTQKFIAGFDLSVTDRAKKYRGVVKDIGTAPSTDCVMVQFHPLFLIDMVFVGINGFCP